MTITTTLSPPNPLTDAQATYNSKALAFAQDLVAWSSEVNSTASTVNSDASAAATSAGTASTQAGIASTQAGIATTKASDAAASAATALNAPGTSATSTTSLTIGTGSKSLTIQSGKSISVGASVIIAYTTTPTTRMSGAVTSYDSGTGALVVNIDTTSGSGTQAAWTVCLGSIAADLSVYAKKAGDDSQLSRQMFIDCAHAVKDKGNVSNATVTFDFTDGSYQTFTATGSTVTWAFSNWPPTGNTGYIEVTATNAGAYTQSISGVTWIKPDGTTTTTFSTYLAANVGRVALQSSGIDKFLFWSRDAGTTIYGKLI